MKYFPYKKDALNYIERSNDEMLVLYQEDIFESGAKQFIACETKDIFNKVQKNILKKRASHYYESWGKKRKICYALDVDIDLDSKDKKKINFDKLLLSNIHNIIKYAKKFYDHTYKFDDVIVLRSNNSTRKLSAHIIFRGLSFENYLVCNNFYKRIIKDKKSSLKYIDPSIYRDTCFRTCYSSKKGKDNALLPYKLTWNGNETLMPDDYNNTSEYFHQTLVTTIDEEEEENVITTKQMEKFEQSITYSKNLPKSTNVNEVKKLLGFVPDKYCESFEKWNKIGMILFSINPDYFELFDEWSKKCAKKYYDGKTSAKDLWNGYTNSSTFNRGLMSIVTLKYIAKEGGYKFDKESLEYVVNAYPEQPIPLSNTELYTVEDINRNFLNPQIYEKIIEKKMIAVQSEKGTGKTSNLLKVILKNKKKSPQSVLFISSRRTFGIKLWGDLEKHGFKLYSDINDHFIHSKRIICQIDSLLRIQVKDFDLIIIDECESLARYMGSSHFTKNKKSRRIVTEFEDLVENCGKLIIMDADLSDRCLNYYTNILSSTINKSNIHVIRNKYTPYQNYNIKYMKYDCWLNKLIDMIDKDDNKKIAIPMASNNKAKDLLSLLEIRYPNKRVLLIHKETKDEDKLKQLQKVNETWVKYDIVIYTPTVCMGVSFDPTYFDNIFAYGCHNSLGAQEFCQMMHRIRYPKDNNIYLCIDHYKYYNEEEDGCKYEEVEKIMCNDYYLTKYDMYNNLLVSKIKREGNERVNFYPYKDEPIYDLQVRNNMERIINTNNFSATFFGYVKFKKYQYEYYETKKDDNIMTNIKQIREERKKKEDDEEVNGLVKAKEINEEEYKNILKIKDNFLTDDNRYEIKKYHFMNTYSLSKSQVTKRVASEYKDKKKISHYRNLSTIVNSEKQKTKDKIKILRNNQSINIDYQNCYQNLTQNNKYVYHYYCNEILTMFGFDINDYDNKDKTVDMEDIKNSINSKFEKFLEDEKYGLIDKFEVKPKQYNYQKFKNNPTTVIRFINFILKRQYGLKVAKANYSKKNIKYYLTTNMTWAKLPHKGVKGKEIKKYKEQSDPVLVDNIKDLDKGLDDSESDEQIELISDESEQDNE